MSKRKTTKSQQPVATTKAAIYIRVSTEEQAQQGYGLAVQRERCKAMVAAKGWGLVGEYADEGISGTKSETTRPGLSALLSAVDAGEVGAVIVLALDRLGRKTSLVLNLVERLTNAGVSLVSCKESLDTSTPQGQFVLTMFAALAQLERDTIVERTTAGRNQRGMIDGEKGGRVPLGYIRADDGMIMIDPDGAAIVKYIFTLKHEGLSLRDIATRLNAEGVPSSRAGQGYSGAWYASSVREVLLNEVAYRGGTRGESAVRWEPIIQVQS